MQATDQIVQELVGLCNPNATPSWATRDRVRQVGQQLDQQGGFALMRQVHDAVAAQASRMHGRILEGYWGGIGEWLS